MKLINTYHGTEYATRKTALELQEIEALAYTSTGTPEEKKAAKAYIRRVRNALCGISDCQCGGTFGERPNYLGQRRIIHAMDTLI